MKRAALVAAVLLTTQVFAGGTIIAHKAALSTTHPLATKVGPPPKLRTVQTVT